MPLQHNAPDGAVSELTLGNLGLLAPTRSLTYLPGFLPPPHLLDNIALNENFQEWRWEK